MRANQSRRLNMSVASERGKATRATSRGRSSSNGSGSTKSSSSGSTRAKSSSSRAKNSSGRAKASASKKPQSAGQRTQGSSQRNHAGREVLTNAGISALSAAIGVAGGVLLGRTAAQRDRKVLGVPVPEKIDLGGV